MYLPEAAVDAIKIFTLGVVSFLVAFGLTPFLTRFLYKHQLWRKEVRTKSVDGRDLSYFQKFHSEGETRVPRFGGLLIWITPLLVVVLFAILSNTGLWWFGKLDFLSRDQTWLPFFALITASLVGLADDFRLRERGNISPED